MPDQTDQRPPATVEERIADLSRQLGELRQELANQRETDADYLEGRLSRLAERIERVDDDARDRDRNLEYSLDEARRRADDARSEAQRAGGRSSW
jgi:phage shock protein A